MLIDVNKIRTPVEGRAEMNEFNTTSTERGEQTDEVKADLSSLTVDVETEGDAENEVRAFTNCDCEGTVVLFMCLFGVFLEKFVDILLVVLPMLLLAINWTSLRQLVEASFWPLGAFVVFTGVASNVLPRMDYFSRFPGYFLYKIYTLIFLLAVYLLLSIHVPMLFAPTKLSPYYAVLTAGTCAASYFLLPILFLVEQEITKGGTKYWGGLIMPALVLIASQPVYFCAFREVSYAVFMMNIGIGLLVALILTYESIYWAIKFSNSVDNPAENTAENVEIISFSKCGVIATLLKG